MTGHNPYSTPQSNEPPVRQFRRRSTTQPVFATMLWGVGLFVSGVATFAGPSDNMRIVAAGFSCLSVVGIYFGWGFTIPATMIGAMLMAPPIFGIVPFLKGAGMGFVVGLAADTRLFTHWSRE